MLLQELKRCSFVNIREVKEEEYKRFTEKLERIIFSINSV